MNPLLDLHLHRKQFGDKLVLQNVRLQVEAGEIVTLVGASGCGKSTLLNLLVGLERPSTGSIQLEGRQQIDRMKIGYVMQDDNLYPWRTLQQNVEFPLELRGVPAEERARIAREYLAKVQLGGFENRYPYELSGGMRQRGNIVRALSYSPRVIIMDEPFGPLDAQTRILLQQQLLDIWQQERKTVIFITHDLHEAIALGDRVMVLTKRPGTVKAVHDIALPRPRDIRHIHEHPEFRRLLSLLGDQLEEEIMGAKAHEEVAA
jgi:NitT/TauT family transport system ATP-binding protein